jgi:hypothetical protein
MQKSRVHDQFLEAQLKEELASDTSPRTER